jgi:ComF family protein
VFYGHPVSLAIHAFKYRGRKDLARPLAGYLIAYLQTHPLPFDGLVPVPLHPERRAARGFNQSELLAHAVGSALGLPVYEGVIARVRATPPQVHLKRQQRLENVKDAFAATVPGALRGGRFLLIDDVCTTGATLQAAAQALHEAGADEIWALTVARARPHPEPEPWQVGLSPAEVFIAWAAMDRD